MNALYFIISKKNLKKSESYETRSKDILFLRENTIKNNL